MNAWLDSARSWIENVMSQLGYPGIFLATIVEVVFPPLPSDLLVTTAGLSAADGVLEPEGIIIAATAGTVVGSFILYAISRFSGEPSLRRWIHRYGHWIRISDEGFERSRRWFQRFGMPLVLLAHFIPGLRSLIAIPAGLSRFPIAIFLALTAIGAAIRAGFQTGLGLLLGWYGLDFLSNMPSHGWIILIVLASLGICMAFMLKKLVIKWMGRRDAFCCKINKGISPHPVERLPPRNL